MASVPTTLISGLSEQTSVANGDYMIVGGSDAKKIKWSTIISLIKSELGIDTINNKIKDTGWVDCTLGSNIVLYGSTPLQVRKIGDIVHIRGIIKNNTAFTDNQSVFTIPEGYRPAYDENYIMQGSGSNRFLLVIKKSGVCSISRYSNNTTTNNSVPTGSWLNIFATWFVN